MTQKRTALVAGIVVVVLVLFAAYKWLPKDPTEQSDHDPQFKTNPSAVVNEPFSIDVQCPVDSDCTYGVNGVKTGTVQLKAKLSKSIVFTIKKSGSAVLFIKCKGGLKMGTKMINVAPE